MLRNDLRQDLPAADVLKMFPMPGWQIVLGEVLAPAAMLGGVQWLLIMFGAVFFPQHFEKYDVPLALRLSVALAAAVVLPFIDLLALLIPNASVLFFPAWFQLGKDTPRGFETMGQQLILMFGQLLVLMFGLAPAAGAFALLLLGRFLRSLAAARLDAGRGDGRNDPGHRSGSRHHAARWSFRAV
jgi:ABC-2 type transport system permease protein